MNTFNPYVVGTSCKLKGGDTADQRMTELNELIASAKINGKGGYSGSAIRTAYCPKPQIKTPPLTRGLKSWLNIGR
jgi:hypothetical protein